VGGLDAPGGEVKGCGAPRHRCGHAPCTSTTTSGTLGVRLSKALMRSDWWPGSRSEMRSVARARVCEVVCDVFGRVLWVAHACRVRWRQKARHSAAHTCGALHRGQAHDRQQASKQPLTHALALSCGLDASLWALVRFDHAAADDYDAHVGALAGLRMRMRGTSAAAATGHTCVRVHAHAAHHRVSELPALLCLPASAVRRRATGHAVAAPLPPATRTHAHTHTHTHTHTNTHASARRTSTADSSGQS
jgi:hypothetical protein